jgi:Bacterial aa3 type cytochrome c oxidase subunit IV
MADHGKVEYATATGNDLSAHEATYKGFVQLAFVGSALCVVIAIGLAIGGTTGRWGIALPLIFLLGPIVAAHGLASGARTPSIVMVVIALLGLVVAAYG